VVQAMSRTELLARTVASVALFAAAVGYVYLHSQPDAGCVFAGVIVFGLSIIWKVRLI
jgi:hypothetical protein